jgi:hypothetical protein
MPRLLRAFALLVAIVIPSASLAQVPAVSPPTLLAPVPAFRANPPVLFQWTAISPTQTFNIGVTSRTGKAGRGVVAVSYELQMSDRIDVDSRVLYDVTLDQTSYLFLNSQSDSGFTRNQPANTPFAGGTFYWRIRGVFAGTATSWSKVGAFTLVGPGIGSSLHSVGLTGISLAGVARVGTPTIIFVQVRDLGNFPETGATLNVFAAGQRIASADIPQLLPGRQVTISATWTPDHQGLVQLGAQLNYSDDNSRAHTISQTAIVTAPQRRRTSMIGVVGETLGSYHLNNGAGQAIATLTQESGSNVSFGLFTGQRVEVEGYLSTARSDFIFEAITIRRLPAP